MTLKDKIRIAYGTQLNFAKAVGVDKRTVSRWILANEIPNGSGKGFEAKKALKTAMIEAIYA